MSSSPVLVAGMARTAVTTSMAHQRARGDEKHAFSRNQHEVSMPNRVRMYQQKIVQSMGR